MIHVRTLSGQERNMRCRKTDTIANVKLGLPIDWATVDPRNIIILKEVEGWRKLPDAQITNGATLYAVNEECINDEDLFNFSKHELPTRWINKLLTGEVNKNKWDGRARDNKKIIRRQSKEMQTNMSSLRSSLDTFTRSAKTCLSLAHGHYARIWYCDLVLWVLSHESCALVWLCLACNIRCVALMCLLWCSMNDSLGSSLRYPLSPCCKHYANSTENGVQWHDPETDSRAERGIQY